MASDEHPSPERLVVVIVDDDEWVRRGRSQALDTSPVVDRVIGLTPHEALLWGVEWAAADVVVVDAHDESEPWDKFVGIRVTQRIREFRTARQTMIVMISGHAANDHLRIRAAEAGADWLFAHRHVRTPADLVRAITAPEGIPLVAPARPSGIDEALELAADSGATALFDGGALQKQVPLSRRNIITLRTRISRLLGLPGPAPLKEIADRINEARGAPPSERPDRS
jgi:DNA-binding NarL/FixJ family response regulator